MSDPNTNNTPAAQVTVIGAPKSVGVALLLTFLLGPLGLLYATVVGGVLMIIVSIVVGIVTFGFGLLITWPLTMIWAVIAVVLKKRSHEAALKEAVAPA